MLRTDAWTCTGSCLVLLGEPGWYNICTNGALVCQSASSSLGICLWCFRSTCLAYHQHRRSLGARGCLDQHRLMPCVDGGTSLAQHWHQRGLSVPRCLEQSTVMLVPLRAPVWPTIGTSGALMRADASTSIGSCLVILGAPGSYNIHISGALDRQGASSNLGTCLFF